MKKRDQIYKKKCIFPELKSKSNNFFPYFHRPATEHRPSYQVPRCLNKENQKNYSPLVFLITPIYVNVHATGGAKA